MPREDAHYDADENCDGDGGEGNDVMAGQLETSSQYADSISVIKKTTPFFLALFDDLDWPEED